MWTKGFVFALLITLVSGLSGCGSDSKTTVEPLTSPSGDEGPKVSITQQFLLGTWSSACVLDPKRSGIYIKEFLQYDIAQMNRLTTSYLDSACTAPIYQQNLESTYLFSSMGVYSETRKSVSILPMSSVAISLFANQTPGFCGDRNWQVNEERTFNDVTMCGGIDTAIKLSLEAHQGTSVYSLSARECEPRNPRDCTTMDYTRAQ